MKQTVVIGAGISGLTAAYSLQKAGRNVVLLERSDTVGGLARSLNINGTVFDIGPHYFFLKTDDRADALVEDCLENTARIFDFQVSVVFHGHNLAWPPNLGSLLRLPFSSIFNSVKNIIRRRFPEDKDCQGFITKFYGRAVYESFMGPYIRKKVPSVAPDKLHREWWLQVGRDIFNRYPQTGTDQTKRIEGRSHVPFSVKARALSKIARGLLSSARGRNLRKVLYPEGGMGCLTQSLARRFEDAGGRLVLDCGPVSLDGSGTRITNVVCAADRFEEPENVIWTGSIHELLKLLGLPERSLPFEDIVLGFARIKATLDLPPYLYTYYAEPDVIFNRAYFPRLIVPNLVPEGEDAVCVEISPGDGPADQARDEDALKNAVLQGLERVGLCRPEAVSALSFLKVPEAYPVYPLDYYETLQEIWKELGRMENLWSIGRSAQFYYNNMARSMAMALDLAEHLTARNPH